MIQVTAQTHVLVAVEPVDFRRGIDGLSRLCREVLSADPFSGAFFVFRNKSAKALKVLAYDGQGFWLCTKRLSQGRLSWWPETPGGGARGRELAAHELAVLLAGGDPTHAHAAPLWRRVGAGR